MRFSHEIMIEYLYDYYRFEYPEIKDEIILELINRIVMNNSEYITYEDVQAKQDYCNCCAWCCKMSNPDCPNLKNNKCTVHNDERQSPLCKEFPWGEYTIYLTINCKYSVNLIKDVIERYLDVYKESLH